MAENNDFDWENAFIASDDEEIENEKVLKKTGDILDVEDVKDIEDDMDVEETTDNIDEAFGDSEEQSSETEKESEEKKKKEDEEKKKKDEEKKKKEIQEKKKKEAEEKKKKEVEEKKKKEAEEKKKKDSEEKKKKDSEEKKKKDTEEKKKKEAEEKKKKESEEKKKKEAEEKRKKEVEEKKKKQSEKKKEKESEEKEKMDEEECEEESSEETSNKKLTAKIVPDKKFWFQIKIGNSNGFRCVVIKGEENDMKCLTCDDEKVKNGVISVPHNEIYAMPGDVYDWLIVKNDSEQKKKTVRPPKGKRVVQLVGSRNQNVQPLDEAISFGESQVQSKEHTIDPEKEKLLELLKNKIEEDPKLVVKIFTDKSYTKTSTSKSDSQKSNKKDNSSKSNQKDSNGTSTPQKAKKNQAQKGTEHIKITKRKADDYEKIRNLTDNENSNDSQYILSLKEDVSACTTLLGSRSVSKKFKDDKLKRLLANLIDNLVEETSTE